MLVFIAAVVLILYAFTWVGGKTWSWIWRDSDRHRWVHASHGPSDHRR